MNDTPTVATATATADVAREMALFEQHFRSSDLTKYSEGRIVAGRIRYAEPHIDKMFTAWLASFAAHTAFLDAGDGYATAFYEIATMLGIGAQAATPADVVHYQIRPKLEMLTARPDNAGMVDRAALAKVLNEAAGPRRVAGKENALLFEDSTPEVQEYWLEVADAVIAAVQTVAAPCDVGRPSDEALDGFLPESVRAEERCGIQRSAWISSGYVAWSSRTDNENAEGPWSHWVSLAHAILKTDAAAIAAAEKSTEKISRFDPPGLWESEHRSTAVVSNEAEEQ